MPTRRRLRARCLIPAIGILALAWPARARGQAIEARTAASVGARLNLGDMGAQYRYADVYGIESAADWTTVDRSRQVGFAAWLAFGRNHSTADDNVEDKLEVWHLGLGLRGGLRLPLRRPTDLIVVVGPQLLRSNSPIPPDLAESFLGVHASVGAEVALSGSYYLQLGVGFDSAPGGPTSLGVSVALGAWGR